MYFFFFFSSRRRHTRFSRDWSSDVCSSDLSSPRMRGIEWESLKEKGWQRLDRSEERRVGKECRYRWSPYHEKKKKKKNKIEIEHKYETIKKKECKFKVENL